MNIVYIILVLFGLLIIFGIRGAIINSKKRKEKLLKMGVTEKDFLKMGGYKCGHPDLDKPIEKTEIIIKDGDINIFAIDKNTVPHLNAKIPVSKVKNILIEDASTLEKRITAARLFAVGIFAFAWKKKQINELSYLIIEWNDDRFDHETIFEYTGEGSIQKSNESRNFLIRNIK